MLSPELSKCLTQPSLDRFHRMQVECETKNMTPMEMYVYLTARYEELLQAEKQAVNTLDLSAMDQAPPHSMKVVKPSAPKAAASHHPLSKQHSNKLEEEYMNKDILNELEESNEFEVHAIYDPYIESVVGKVFSVVDDPHVQSVVNMLLETGDVHAKTSFVVDNSFVRQVNGVLECTVCRMQFDNRKGLDTHLTHSPIHSVNMKIRQEIFQTTLKEAERLAKLAQLTINKLQGKDPAADAETPREEGPEANARLRWKKAANKVICNRLKAQFLPLLEQMCETPAGVKMLHAGSKYFYKSKITFDLHIYQHTAHDIVEVVPHFIPGRKQKYASIVAFPRIYLDYRTLIPLVLGMDITNSRLSMQAHAVSATILPTSNNFASGVTSRVVAMTASSEGEGGDGNLSKTIEQALTSFVLNHLHVVHEAKSSTYALIFDSDGIENNPVVQKPAEVRPVPISIDKIKSQYAEQLRRKSLPRPTSGLAAAVASAAISCEPQPLP